MISKSIIVMWSLICGWVLFKALSDAGPGYATEIIFYQILIWGAVVVPTALIGLLFKRNSRYNAPMAYKPEPKSKLTDAERPKRFVDMAHELGASDDPKDFEKAFKKVVAPKSSVISKRSKESREQAFKKATSSGSAKGK
jgi:hypothetical protein